MKKYIYAVILLIVVAIAGFFTMRGSLASLTARSVNAGQVSVRNIVKTEKLKVLTMYKEVLVNQYKKNTGLLSLFQNSENQICTIYPARLDFGFDLSKCDEDWIRQDGDSVIVTLPPVEVLNKNGESLDETNKRVPIENGSWTADEKEDFRERAKAIMLRSCEADGCYKMAEEQGVLVMKNLIEALGFDKVRIDIQPRNHYGLGRLKEGFQDNNPYTFHVGKKSYLKYKQGGIVIYNMDGLNYEQLLAFADFYKVALAKYCKFVRLEADNGVIHVQLMMPHLVKGTPRAKEHISKRDAKRMQGVVNQLKGIFGEDSKLVVFETGANNDVLINYNNQAK